jgi:transcriptional regulator with XRE-family HTH domain
LRLARQRRRIPLVELAERVNTTRTTLTRLEQGDLTVSLALLVRVLGVLGLEEDLDKLAADDELGRRLQDVRMPRPRRARIDRPTDE